MNIEKIRCRTSYIIRYIFRNIFRNSFRSISFFALALILMSTLCFLQVTATKQEKELHNYYKNMTVTVVISDINGVTDNLYIPGNYIGTFTDDIYGLSEYLEHVSLKRSMLLLNEEVHTLFADELSESKEKARLIGISNLASEDDLSEINGVSIHFFDGYDESVLQGDKPVCLINERLYEMLYGNKENISIKAKSFDHIFVQQELQPAELDMRIIGEIQGGKPYDIYCSWNSICELGSVSDGSDPYSESMSAIIVDNNKLNEFKEKAKRYYTKVDISKGASEYSFALTVYDSQLVNGITAINRNLHFVKLVSSVILFLSSGIGFFVCFLSTKNRNIEFALLRSLGLSRFSVICIAMLEQLVLSIIALIISFLVVIFSNERELGFPYNIIFFLLFMVGGLISMYRTIFSNILKSLREE
mgnify:CR=1 FL=1